LFSLLSEAQAKIKKKEYSEAERLLKALEGEIQKLSAEEEISENTSKIFELLLLLAFVSPIVVIVIYKLYLRDFLIRRKIMKGNKGA
jgi:hypothetical protein